MKNRIAIILPYKSPHVMPFIEALFDIGVEMMIGIEHQFNKYRPYLIEKEYPNLSFINFYDGKKDFFFDKIKNYSIGISLGVFHSTEVVKFAKYFSKKNRKFYLISETEHGLKKNIFKKLLKRPISLLINKRNFYLLAIGGIDCFNYYKRIGLKPRIAYNFGYFTYKNFNSNQIKQNNNGLLNLISVSQLIKRKNIIYILTALNNLNEFEQKKVKFTIIGDGELKQQLVDYSKKLHCQIDFKGNITEEDVKFKLMEENDFLVLPSLFDGWGAVVNEGVSLGLGVLLSNKVMAGNELLSDGENGFSFNIDSIDDLVKILKKLLSLNENYDNFKKSSLEIASFWQGKVAAERFLEVLNNENITKWNEGPFSLKFS